MRRRNEPRFNVGGLSPLKGDIKARMENYAMNTWKILLSATAALLFAGQAAAQTDESAEQRRTVEVREVEVRKIKEREEEVERRMYDAERRMAEAARQIAELTAERLPQLEGFRQ